METQTTSDRKAGELREGCGNKGFGGLPCFQNSKFGCWPRRWPKRSETLTMEHRHQLELRGSCGKVAGTRDLATASDGLKSRKADFVMASISMEILGSLWFPTVFIDFRNPCAGGRYANYRNHFWRLFQNLVFSVAGTNGRCKTICFLLREQKGFPATVKKPWLFLLREDMGVSKETKGITFLLKSSCGVQWFFCLDAGARSNACWPPNSLRRQYAYYTPSPYILDTEYWAKLKWPITYR